jgi:UTP--glucose-1-phosphate uridylyltransferase
MKAVIPAAGLGTRFLPVTKNAPKEMLPLIDKPAIQYVVEEAVDSGCDDILIITGRGKTSIEDHFDKAPELERHLETDGKNRALERIQEIAELADIHYVRQKEPLGLGHAISCARKHVGDEPFAVLLGDDVVFSDTPCTKQLIDQYERTGSSIIAVEEITPEQAPAYGVVDVDHSTDDRLLRTRDLVEKPASENAPSNLGILGRYVLTPEIFDAIEQTPPGVGNEIQLTDALELLGKDQDIYSYAFEGKRYDLGNKMDWLKTNVEVALMHDEFKEEFREFIESVADGEPELHEVVR